MVCSGIAYAFIPFHSCGNGADDKPLKACGNVQAGAPCCTKANNMGWRYLLFTLGGITLVVFFLRFVLFRFQESPKFLLYRGKDEKAIRVLHNVARFNKRESTITTEVLAGLTDEDSSLGSAGSRRPILGGGAKQVNSSTSDKMKLEFSRYKILFATASMARLTILVWVIYAFDYWGFTIAGTLIRIIHLCLSKVLTEILRILPPDHPSAKKRRHQRLRPRNLPRLRHHLYLWHPWRPPRHSHVRHPINWPQMGNGHL